MFGKDPTGTQEYMVKWVSDVQATAENLKVTNIEVIFKARQKTEVSDREWRQKKNLEW